jgi:hypothetical protein
MIYKKTWSTLKEIEFTYTMKTWVECKVCLELQDYGYSIMVSMLNVVVMTNMNQV